MPYSQRYRQRTGLTAHSTQVHVHMMMMALHSAAAANERHDQPEFGSPAPAPALSLPSQTDTASSAPTTPSVRACPTIPKLLYYTTLATLGLSVLMLGLASIDLGTVSFFLNIPAAGLTILHDAMLLRMARRRVVAPGDNYYYFEPAASGFNICVLAACALMYFLGFCMTVFTGVFAQRGDISWETGTGMGTIVAQAALAPLTCALVLVAFFQSVRMRKLGSPRLRLYGQF